MRIKSQIHFLTKEVGILVISLLFSFMVYQCQNFLCCIQALSPPSSGGLGAYFFYKRFHQLPSITFSISQSRFILLKYNNIQTAENPIGGLILVGLFSKPVPEGLPIYGTLLPAEGEFCFDDVQPGRYYLMATSISWRMETTDVLLPEKTLRYRSTEAIIVKDAPAVPFQQVTLRPALFNDPPILVSLPR